MTERLTLLILTFAIVVCGCVEQPGGSDTQRPIDTRGSSIDTSHDDPADKLSVSSIEETNQAESTPTISQTQILRLFDITWDANNSATMAYSANQSSDPESLKTYAWLQCIQLKSSVFFKDSGLKWKSTSDDFLVDLPVKSQEFNDRIRIIDNYHFAFNDGKHWLVFRARDWEDDHYTPPQ
jgi:hypothetical protein